MQHFGGGKIPRTRSWQIASDPSGGTTGGRSRDLVLTGLPGRQGRRVLQPGEKEGEVILA